MKTIAILTALNAEGKQFEAVFGNPLKTDLYGHFTIKTYDYKGNTVLIAKSGVGEILAASCTELLIALYKADLIVNFGLAGGYKCHKRGDTAVVTKVVHYDFDTSKIDNCKPAHYVDMFDSEYIETDKELVNLAKSVDNGLIDGLLASGDKFIADEKAKEDLYNLYNATLYDMEAAAVTIVCKNSGVKHLIIKVVSDSGNSEEFYEFKDFIKDTKTKFIDLVQRIIDNYIQ